MKKLLLILPTFCFIINLSAMDDPRYERLSKQAEDYYNRADPSTSAKASPYAEAMEDRSADRSTDSSAGREELYYEDESSDEDYYDEERIREELRELKYEKTFDCKYCGKCPTIDSSIRCEDVMNDYWKEFATLSQEEKQDNFYRDHKSIGDWKHTRCHIAGAICTGLNANINENGSNHNWRILHISVALGDYQLVKHLLEVGRVGPNQYDEADDWSPGGFHPLCLARSERMKDLLVKHGAVLDKPCPKEKEEKKIEQGIKQLGDFEEKEGGLS